MLMICRELAENRVTRRRDLRAVALTCREWFGPGVEYLWQDLGYFEPILASLPADLWVTQSKDKDDKGDDSGGDEGEEEGDFEESELPRREMRRQLKEEDLLRFKMHYARHIKALWVCRDSIPPLQFLQNLKSITDADKTSLLPRLHTLYWLRHSYNIDPGPYFPFIVCFVNEKLKTLAFAGPPSSPEVQTTVTLLNERCPSLTDLEVTESALDNGTLTLDTISLMTEQWENCLRRLDLNYVTHEQLRKLSTLPHLQTLIVTNLGSLDTPTWSDPSSPKKPPLATTDTDAEKPEKTTSIPFPSLRDLTVTTRDLYPHCMIPFLQYLSPASSNLKRLFISSEGCAPISHWKQVVDLIISRCNRDHLESIYFGENDDAGFAPSGFVRQRWEDREPFPLSPLLVFKNLRDFGHFVFYSAPITKDALKEVVSGWKHLTKLDVSFPDSDGIYDKFHLDCHDLLFVPVPVLCVPHVFVDEDEHQNDRWMEAIEQVDRVRAGKPLQLDSDSAWETESETDSVAASDDGYCADLDTLFER
ncbi:hypothetical protein EST38_g6590 [Candolleomyces aberdarensis]|uniref:F-box domain-containing protein n=1 Tax=Candolleomyces aberdarensis TaxID=2316362 RepID=A0A4Q2DJ90_9AGAR|nr:hypothetical protein EST38_g6590 [Candolleomyces aberdarensis]